MILLLIMIIGNPTRLLTLGCAAELHRALNPKRVQSVSKGPGLQQQRQLSNPSENKPETPPFLCRGLNS